MTIIIECRVHKTSLTLSHIIEMSVGSQSQARKS
jgi:hypothetical protein